MFSEGQKGISSYLLVRIKKSKKKIMKGKIIPHKNNNDTALMMLKFWEVFLCLNKSHTKFRMMSCQPISTKSQILCQKVRSHRVVNQLSCPGSEWPIFSSKICPLIEGLLRSSACLNEDIYTFITSNQTYSASQFFDWTRCLYIKTLSRY